MSDISALDPDQVKELEQIRIRLQKLCNSLQDLSETVATAQTLPSWSELQNYSVTISRDLRRISKLLSRNRELLSSTVAYPLPHFPSAQGQLLQHLLRTKPEPEAKEWAEAGQKPAKASTEVNGGVSLSQDERDNLWSKAPLALNEELRKQNWGGDYTLAEQTAGIENVQHGLKRKLEELVDPTADADQESDDNGSDEDMLGDEDKNLGEEAGTGRKKATKFDFGIIATHAPQPPQNSSMPLDIMLRFISTGSMNTAKLP